MTPEPESELLNVYDVSGAVTGARPRAEAKAAGLAVGAVNVLLLNGRGEVLLQRRQPGKENGGRWDKSVGGHVAAGEDFDDTARRECGEELFDDPASPRVRLVSLAALTDGLDAPSLGRAVFIAPVARHLNLRDVRIAPDGTIRNVFYHVGVYAGRTEIPVSTFTPQPSEVTDLAYFSPGVLDLMLLRGQVAPNMAFLWLAHGRTVLGLLPRA
jgi:ADP-ribose pyrophosphatase YjhB (NUDIX family)